MKAVINLFKSFGFAFCGIARAVKNCRNFRIHLVATAYVIYFSRFYNLDSVSYAVLFLTFGSVITAEAFNSALEYACNAVTSEYSKNIKYAKDAAAAAVLICAIFAIGVAISLFLKTDVIASIIQSAGISDWLIFAFSVIVSAFFIFYEDVLNNGK